MKEIHSAIKFILLMMDGFQSINVAKWVIACAMSQSIHHLILFKKVIQPFILEVECNETEREE